MSFHPKISKAREQKSQSLWRSAELSLTEARISFYSTVRYMGFLHDFFIFHLHHLLRLPHPLPFAPLLDSVV